MNLICTVCHSNKTKLFSLPLTSNSKEKSNRFVPTSSDFGIFYRLVECENCGVVFSAREPDAEDLHGLYSDAVDSLYTSQLQERRIMAGRILSSIQDVVSQKGRLLDIGSSYGTFLGLAQENNWQVEGVELNQDACNFSKETYGFNVFCGDLKGANFLDNSYDVVTAIEVIEHVTNPNEFLIEINRILKPSGILFLVTPDLKSLSAKLLGMRWWSFREMHLHYFSKKSLFWLLNHTNFFPLKNMPYKKTFRLEYVLSQPKVYNKSFYRIMSFLDVLPVFNKVMLHASFGDFAIIAQKRV